MNTVRLDFPPVEASLDTMQALVYRGPSKPSWQAHRRPTLKTPGDAIVRLTTTSICGSDLHILKGDVPSVEKGRVLGHEGVGVVEEAGAAVTAFRQGDRVIISCITACGECDFCRRQMYSHCRKGGWLLGNTIDGTQAEFVRIPYADTSLHALPPGIEDEAAVMLSDTLPTGFECGVRSGAVKDGDTVAVVGAGPVGLAALMTAQFCSPSAVICIDLDDNRLKLAKELGATHLVNSANGKAAARVLELTNGEGVNVAIEAVGVPAAFDICQAIVAVGGHIANVGVHGKPVTLHLEKLWDRNVTLTTRLVDTVTTPMLIQKVVSGNLQAGKLVTHQFALKDILEAYDTFGNAAKYAALKVALKAG